MSEQERLQNSGQNGEGETKVALTRVRGLTIIFVILTVLLIVLVVNSPEGALWRAKWQAHWKAQERERQFQEALARDPKVGTEASKLGEQLKQIAGESKKLTLVIVFQGCEGCGAQNLQEIDKEFIGNYNGLTETLEIPLGVRETYHLREGEVISVILLEYFTEEKKPTKNKKQQMVCPFGGGIQ